MGEPTGGNVRPDWDTYRKNRYSYPLEEVNRYCDQWLAWSADGSRIVAHDADLLRVNDQVKAAGVDPEEVIFEYIPPGGEGESLLPSLLDVDAEP